MTWSTKKDTIRYEQLAVNLSIKYSEQIFGWIDRTTIIFAYTGERANESFHRKWTQKSSERHTIQYRLQTDALQTERGKSNKPELTLKLFIEYTVTPKPSLI